MLLKLPISTLSFKQWLLSEQENKLLLWFSALLMIVYFGWIKYLYPYPNFIPPDSYNYLESANNNDFINIWPTGYAKFLRLVSVATHSHVALVIIQYLLLMVGVLYFLFTIRFLLSPGKWLFRLLLVITIINPLLPHIANFVSSDCLFATLSIIWFTQLMWIIYKTSPRLLILHAIVVLLAFMTRFTAIYYPILSLVIICIVNMNNKNKWLGIGMIALPILTFIGRTQYEYKSKTDTMQYSAFGGWQLAANALYGYAYVKPDNLDQLPYMFRELHAIVNQHMDSIQNLPNRPDAIPGIYYLWDFKSPLRLYVNKIFGNKSKKSFFEQWAYVAPLYGKYGRWLIREHPGSFIKHYVWPNFLRYYAPPANFMGTYNLGKKTVDPIGVSWFKWKNNQLPNRLNSKDIYIMTGFPTILAIVNPAFIACTLFFIFFAGIRNCNNAAKGIIGCTLLVWLSNTIFSVLSAPIELRYQIFPVIITLPFLLLFVSYLVQLLKVESKTIKKRFVNTSAPGYKL